MADTCEHMPFVLRWENESLFNKLNEYREQYVEVNVSNQEEPQT